MPFRKILYGMSYANFILYGSAIPEFGGTKDGNGAGQPEEVVDSSDPNNWEKIKDFYRSRR